MVGLWVAAECVSGCADEWWVGVHNAVLLGLGQSLGVQRVDCRLVAGDLHLLLGLFDGGEALFHELVDLGGVLGPGAGLVGGSVHLGDGVPEFREGLVGGFDHVRESGVLKRDYFSN